MKNTINEMVVIDGSQGEGGGQIFRTTLSLAMCLGISVNIINIRAGRKKPGLLRQHLTCLKAAKAVCNATVTGDELGGTAVTFLPGDVTSGEYHFSIGSAGSTTLVFQTLVMPLLLADGISELTLEGGTHNGMSPSYDFIRQCFIPMLERMGCRLTTEIERIGFYPAGGGLWRVRIHPIGTSADVIAPLKLLDPGRLIQCRASAMSDKIPEHVTERELEYIRKKLTDLCSDRCSDLTLQQKLIPSVGPGNIVSLLTEMDNVTEVFECVGERNISAERVAGRVVRDCKRYLTSGVPVGEHLADQLLLPMVLGQGGSFRTLKPSQHLLTNIAVIKQMTGVEIKLTEMNQDCWQVDVPEINYK